MKTSEKFASKPHSFCLRICFHVNVSLFFMQIALFWWLLGGSLIRTLILCSCFHLYAWMILSSLLIFLPFYFLATEARFCKLESRTSIFERYQYWYVYKTLQILIITNVHLNVWNCIVVVAIVWKNIAWWLACRFRNK